MLSLPLTSAQLGARGLDVCGDLCSPGVSEGNAAGELSEGVSSMCGETHNVGVEVAHLLERLCVRCVSPQAFTCT